MKDLPNVEEMRCEPTEPCQPVGLTAGSITFSPDRSKPTYSAGEILALAESSRLRTGLADAILEVRRIKLWWDAAHPLMEYQVRVYPWEVK